MTSPPPAADFRADTLKSRTFIGLLVAQFLAAFNDQAIHAAAMFFALNEKILNEASAISLMPILFYAPWALFCTLAGYLADRYSKRQALVFWKFAEIAITAVALLGFYLGQEKIPVLGMHIGPWVVLSTVFLMGTHSAFFVPAKYGAMPEILEPQLLSRGNGLLESLSFLAVILGTVSGGMLSFFFRDREVIIGIILMVLAIVGAVASLMIRKMPAADPTRPFPPYLFKPLWDNLKTLVSSRPLALAVLGIAFFTFIVAFMRATVYMLGESQNPRWNEFKTSAVVGTVALGIGLGSPMAGWLSGRKVELGLVPLGAFGMVAGTVLAAVLLDWVPGLIACIVLIGFSTGFYIVPLFTLLQHRAPKASKGEVIATSNFINVLGAISATLLFFVVATAAQRSGLVPRIEQQDRFAVGILTKLEVDRFSRPAHFEVTTADGSVVEGGHPPRKEPPAFTRFLNRMLGRKELNGFRRPLEVIDVEPGVSAPDPATGEAGSEVIASRYELRGVPHFRLRPEGASLPEAYDKQHLPRYLFLGAGLMILFSVVLMYRQLPDLLDRARWLLRSLGKGRLHVSGLQHVPADGPTILATNCVTSEDRQAVATATDRFTLFLSADATDADLADAEVVLRRGDLVGLALEDLDSETWFARLRTIDGVRVLPVYLGERVRIGLTGKLAGSAQQVVIGPALAREASLDDARAVIAQMKSYEVGDSLADVRH